MPTQEQPMIHATWRPVGTEHVLGTPITVVVSFTNASTHPVSFSIGNGRSDGYRFEATPEAVALDPYFEFGGLAAVHELTPGQQTDDEILLNKYLRFTRPGRYAVTGELDLDVTNTLTGAVRLHHLRETFELDMAQDPARQTAALTRLAADLESPDPQRQMTASYLLSELREGNAVPIMARGLRLTNGAVVENLLLGLGRVESEEARRALDAFAAATPSEKLKALARQQLAQPSY